MNNSLFPSFQSKFGAKKEDLKMALAQDGCKTAKFHLADQRLLFLSRFSRVSFPRLSVKNMRVWGYNQVQLLFQMVNYWRHFVEFGTALLTGPFLLFSLTESATLVDVNIFIRSFSNIDDVKMVSTRRGHCGWVQWCSKHSINKLQRPM